MSGKSNKAEIKRLEELQKKVELQQKKLKTEKSKIQKERKVLESDKKKISSGWKELDRAKKKFADQKELSSKQGLSSSVKQKRSSGVSNKKMQQQLFEMKKKYEAEVKKSRGYRKKLDQLEVENKVLRNKVKNLSGRKRGKTDDKRLRQLMRENRELRKRLRKIMKELNKRRRWYKRRIKVFRKNQDKWIKGQRKAWKDKKFIIKYVFLDDVKYIKQYQKPRKGREKIKFRNRIRVKTKGGGETTVKGVEIIVMDENDDDSDDSEDSEIGADGKKKKKKKKKKGKNGDADNENEEDEDDDDKKKKKKKKKKGKSEADEEEDLDKYLEQMAAEFGMKIDEIEEDEEELKSDEDEEDDIGDDDEDFEADDDEDEDAKEDDDLLSDEDLLGDDSNDSLEAQMVYLRQEMSERANDLDKLKAILDSSDEHQDPKKEIEALVNETIADRQDEMIKNLENLGGDPKDNEFIKESNDEWKKYVLNLSQNIIDNTQQFNCLLNMINDGFLKELNGRIKDLNDVNNVYYDEDIKEEEEAHDFAKLKTNVDQRHDEISSDVNTTILKQKEDDDDEEEDNNEDNDNDSKIKELYQGLLTTNQNWNELISESEVFHKESQTEKNNLIEQLFAKYTKLQELVSKVENIPSTVLF